VAGPYVSVPHIAIHEAAHVVVGHAMGLRPVFMTTRPQGHIGGIAKFLPREDHAGRLALATMALAAAAAESRLNGASGEEIATRCESDLQLAAEQLGSLVTATGVDARELLMASTRIAGEMVAALAPRIRNLAAHVERAQGALGPEQLEEAIARFARFASAEKGCTYCHSCGLCLTCDPAAAPGRAHECREWNVRRYREETDE
jgi:hypothetical protein